MCLCRYFSIHEELSAAVLAGRGMAGRSPSRVLLLGVSPPTTRTRDSFLELQVGSVLTYSALGQLSYMCVCVRCESQASQVQRTGHKAKRQIKEMGLARTVVVVL